MNNHKTQEIIHLLHNSGFECYIVGGAVRDYVSGEIQMILILQQMLHQNKSIQYLNRIIK